MNIRYILVILFVIFSSSKGNCYTTYVEDPLLTVEVDKRIELYFVTAFISESFFKRWITINDVDYAKDMESYFSAYKSHPAVTFFEQTWKRDMSSYIPPEIMIYLSDSLNEQSGLDIPREIIDQMGGMEKKNEFITKIKDFAIVTNFNEFYKLHHDYYENLKLKIQTLMESRNCIKKLNDFYGTSQNHYYALLVPLLGPGNGYGPSIPADNEKSDVYCLFSPYQSDEQIVNLLWHEFGHSFVNPIVAKYIVDVNKNDELYTPIESSMKPLYSDWEEALSEHLVRVNTAQLVRSEYGKSLSKKHLKEHEIKGFIYINLFAELIEYYERHRRSYPTFEAYFPQILEKLKSVDPDKYILKDNNIFTGPLNAISKNVSYIIVPTNEVNDSIEQVIRDYTIHVQKFFQERFDTEVEIITDEEALVSDISGGDILVYGTMNGNLLLKAYAEKFPFTIDPEKIVADKVYKGSSLRFMSIWPHFQSKSRGMAIYTAQRAEHIWGINGIYHGSTDYLIIKDDKPQGSGYYKKNGEHWDF